MPDSILIEAWDFCAAMSKDDPEHRAFCERQRDKAIEQFAADAERELKVLEKFISDEPWPMTGTGLSMTIPIRIPNRFTFKRS